MRKFKQIYLEINRDCNLHCSFCPHNNDDNLKNKTWNLDTFKHIVNETANYCDFYYLHVVGEPLINPNLYLYLDYLKMLNKEVRISSNGITIKDHYKKLLSYPNLTRINLSLQAYEYLNEDAYLYLIDNLVSLINYHDAIKSETTICLRLWNNPNNKDIERFNEKINNSIKEILNVEIINKHIKPYLLIDKDQEFVWPNLNLDEESYSSCYGGKTMLAVLNNGDVVLCCLDYSGKTTIGNLKNDSFKNILNGEKYQSHLSMLKNNQYYFELCQKCHYRTRFKKEK